MTVRFAAAVVAVLALAACSKGHKAPHEAAQEDPNAPHAVVVRPDSNLPSKKDIAALFDEWNDTLRTGGPHDMALLYAEDGVLLPTVSNDVRSNRVEIGDYFEHFLKLHPRGTINEQHIDVLDSNTAVNSGVYTFDLIKEAQPTFVVARYSFVYEKIGGRWLIKSHHSSAMPEPTMTRPPALAQLLASNETLAEVAPAPEAAHEPAAELRPTTPHATPAAAHH